MKTILEVFKAEPESNKQLIKELIARGSKSDAAKNSLDRFVKKLILPVVMELHPEVDNFKNDLLLGTMPDISIPLDWDTIFDRVSTKNKHFTL